MNHNYDASNGCITISHTRYQVPWLLVNLLQTKFLFSCVGRHSPDEQTRLQSVVNFATHVIFNRQIVYELNWLSVQNRLKLDTAYFMYEFMRDLVSDTISHMFNMVTEVTQ